MAAEQEIKSFDIEVGKLGEQIDKTNKKVAESKDKVQQLEAAMRANGKELKGSAKAMKVAQKGMDGLTAGIGGMNTMLTDLSTTGTTSIGSLSSAVGGLSTSFRVLGMSIPFLNILTIVMTLLPYLLKVKDVVMQIVGFFTGANKLQADFEKNQARINKVLTRTTELTKKTTEALDRQEDNAMKLARTDEERYKISVKYLKLKINTMEAGRQELRIQAKLAKLEYDRAYTAHLNDKSDDKKSTIAYKSKITYQDLIAQINKDSADIYSAQVDLTRAELDEVDRVAKKREESGKKYVEDVKKNAEIVKKLIENANNDIASATKEITQNAATEILNQIKKLVQDYKALMDNGSATAKAKAKEVGAAIKDTVSNNSQKILQNSEQTADAVYTSWKDGIVRGDKIAEEAANHVTESMKKIVDDGQKDTQKLNEDIVKLNESTQESITNASEENAKTIDGIEKKAEENAEALAAKKRALEDNRAAGTINQQEYDDSYLILAKAEEANNQAKNDALLAQNKSYQNKATKITEEAEAKRKEITESYTEQRTQATEQMLTGVAESASSTLSSLSTIEGENTKKGIKLKKASTMISMAEGLAKGISSAASAPWPANIAAIASTIALLVADFAQVKQMQSQATYSKGGIVRGAGSGTSDEIPARLSNGESVINARGTAAYAPILDAINRSTGGNAITTASNNNMLGNMMASAVASMPNPIVSVESINKQSAIYNKVAVK